MTGARESVTRVKNYLTDNKVNFSDTRATEHRSDDADPFGA
jgi:hypothetical protein